MANIASPQKLRNDPGAIDAASVLGVSMPELVGIVHFFWWWCVDHAEDGDLRRYNDALLASAAGWSLNDGKRLVESLVKGRFIERDPYFRVVDWWRIAGNALRDRYKDTPLEWRRIRDLYSGPVSIVADEKALDKLPQVVPLKNHISVQNAVSVVCNASKASVSVDSQELIPDARIPAFPVDGSEVMVWAITVGKVKQYESLYPNLDVVHEIKKSQQWIVDNPAKRKTAKGMLRYISGWLGRAQDGSGRRNGYTKPGDAIPKPGKYANFPNRVARMSETRPPENMGGNVPEV